jgi:hypothetical protein
MGYGYNLSLGLAVEDELLNFHGGGYVYSHFLYSESSTCTVMFQ